TGRSRHERVEPEPERRVGQLQHEPALRNRLHPRADIREKRAHPEETVITMRKRAKHSAAASGYRNLTGHVFVLFSGAMEARCRRGGRRRFRPGWRVQLLRG